MQKSFKRLMGYSTIGHVGFLVGAIASMNYVLTDNPVSEVPVSMGLFAYIFIYLLSFLGALGCVLLLAKEERISTDLISDLRFMIQANPTVAWCMVLFMLSMAGIPPTIGLYKVCNSRINGSCRFSVVGCICCFIFSSRCILLFTYCQGNII